MNNYESPRWTAEIADCSMPMTFDQYSMCGFGCRYCFSQFQRAIGKSKESYIGGNLKAVDPDKIIAMFRGQTETQFSEFIAKRKFVQWGGLSDPFCTIEKRHGVGLKILRALREMEYPVSFSTKGTWWAYDERYAELFRGAKNWHVKVSIITPDPVMARAIELRVPSPASRLRLIEKLAGFGLTGVTLRLRPFIPGISSTGYRDLIRAAGAAGADSVSTEFFCLETRSKTMQEQLREMRRVTGFHLGKFYRDNSRGAGYLRLNREYKRQYIEGMEAAAQEAGMRFYVSDAHFKEKCHNGSCCGLPAGANYSRGQFCEALMVAKKTGKVAWEDIEGDLAYAKRFKWRSAAGYNTRSTLAGAQFWHHSMYDYVRWLWNNPKAGQSPYTMFGGILRPLKLDPAGNVVYGYDKTKE